MGCQLSDVFFGGRFSDYLQRVATLYNLFVACNSFHMFPISFKETNQPKHLQDFYDFFLHGEIRWVGDVWFGLSRYFINRLSGCCFRRFRWEGVSWGGGEHQGVGWEDQILRCAPKNLPQRLGVFNSFREVCFRFCLVFFEWFIGKTRCCGLFAGFLSEMCSSLFQMQLRVEMIACVFMCSI